MTAVASEGQNVDLAWDLQPIAGKVGVAVRGIDLHGQVDQPHVDAIRRLLADYGVVVFPEQHLGRDDHVRFAEMLGEIKLPPKYMPNLGAEGHEAIAVISTENSVAYTTDRWHADVTWLSNPPKYSILHMEQIPPVGGDTMWASQLEAYDWLSEPMKQLLEGLTAEHALLLKAEMTAQHPVVIVHPITRRKALFVNSAFTQRILELTPLESRAILDLLYQHSVRPEMVCRWRWSEGDLAVWDNHFVQHYAIGDYHPAPRTIHRIEIVGERPVPASS
ncbi:MAG: TauD/TfdA family dioxygenase [Acidobacteria bacterium]|nr:TauD/TfdA family dioxygenase [Acidobacteriota bacterium]